MPTILHASVSPTILTKGDRLFTKRLDDLFIELFQHARRAGATRIDVTTRLLPAPEGEVSSKPQIEVTVTDNGTGIADFSTLLCLGNSNWDADISEREDAAGMGFSSLVHSRYSRRSITGHSGAAIRRHWDKIPLETDVLVTHGPPFGILDQTGSNTPHLGCEELAKVVENIAPRLHLFGHIHGGHGRVRDSDGTEFVNASVLNEMYMLVHEPQVVDLEI